jgi:hypothetical protein
MSSASELLALRKEVLLARSSLQRLKSARAAGALRESLRWPRAAAAVVASPQSHDGGRAAHQGHPPDPGVAASAPAPDAVETRFPAA